MEKVRSRNSYLTVPMIEEDDINAVVEVLRGDYLTTGPKVKEFEENLARYTGAKYAVAVSNGTAALHAACFAAGIKEGDEVITTPITFAASANCLLYMGQSPFLPILILIHTTLIRKKSGPGLPKKPRQ